MMLDVQRLELELRPGMCRLVLAVDDPFQLQESRSGLFTTRVTFSIAIVGIRQRRLQDTHKILSPDVQIAVTRPEPTSYSTEN